MGAQRHAEHLAGEVAYLVGGAGQLDAAPLAASAGMDLGLDHPRSLAQTLGPLPGTGTVVADVAVRDRHAEFPEDCLSLILVNVHSSPFLSVPAAPYKAIWYWFTYFSA